MKEKINHYLAQIEREKNIKVLLACETGSRAWGFPSPDSDYDIRLIYVHEKDWYLSLTEKKDTIERMLENNDLDISGWDLRKTLRLLWKSNPPLLERIQSPILYQHDEAFLMQINELAQTCYSQIATVHHYLGMARKCYEEVTSGEAFKLKKFFYALRTATVCKWILERTEIPPIEFAKVMNGLAIEPYLVKRIKALIALKSTVSEAYWHQGEEELLSFIGDCIAEAKENAGKLPSACANKEDLNEFFRRTLTN